jgi:glutathione S-transferase
MESEEITLVVRRTIRATAKELFAAWTEPDQLRKWWGPRPVVCADAEVDLRVGGTYRIANRLPDGTLLWIFGEFEVIDPPSRLVYTWRIGPRSHMPERVSVQFDQYGDVTEVTVTHQRIPDAGTSAQHEQGWIGCLDGLAAYLRP